MAVKEYGCVDKRSNLTREEFVKEYIAKNKPVVITDGLKGWKALSLWTPEYFDKLFGHWQVVVQGASFSSLNQVRFSDFIHSLSKYEHLEREGWDQEQQVPYLRYSDTTGATSTDDEAEAADFNRIAIRELKDDWLIPYFMPRSRYFSPLNFGPIDEAPGDEYPELGVYLSPRGAVTAFHLDQGHDSAILCQTYGKKQGFMFSPDQKEKWSSWLSPTGDRANRMKVAIDLLDGKLPDYGDMEPLQFELNPGEVMYIPDYWAHEVFTLSASISLTYNFIHVSNLARWLRRYYIGKKLRQYQAKVGRITKRFTSLVPS